MANSEVKGLINVERGQRLTRKQFIANGNYPVVGGGFKYCNYYNQMNTPEDTITISRSGSCGSICYYERPFYCTNSAFKLTKPKQEKINYFYLFTFLKQHENKIKKLGRGAGVEHLKQ